MSSDGHRSPLFIVKLDKKVESLTIGACVLPRPPRFACASYELKSRHSPRICRQCTGETITQARLHMPV